MNLGNCEIPAVDEVVDAIKRGKRFLMVPHRHIDGDDLGCMIGLALALKQLNKEVYLFSDDPVPERYKFLEGHELVTNILPEGTFSAVFVLECPDYKRLPKGIVPKKLTQTIITLDHHNDNPNEQRFKGNINWVDATMSALGEMLALVCFRLLGLELSKAAATALYTSIVSDSQAFRFHGVSPRTHYIAAQLLERADIDTDTVHFWTISYRSETEEKITNRCKESREYLRDGNVVTAVLNRAMFGGTNAFNDAGYPDDSYVQNLLPDINNQGAEVFVLFKDLTGDKIRVSLRSKRIPVVSIAHKHKGGGHDLACAMTFDNAELEEVRKVVVADVMALLDKAGV